ncbi:MAG: hypothetical protein K6T83_00155 [Alicyclobacillus sp.]|nr:hypothetical protein [Alicyclobacillus sp.]
MSNNLDQMRQDQLRLLSQSRDPLSIMRRYNILMAQVYETLTKLTIGEDLDEITERLDALEECDSQIREYLYEEAGATLGHYDDKHGQIVFDSLPSALRLVPTGHGFVVENLPAWMLGHGAKKKYHPLYHKGRPFVRKRQLWHWLFHKLKWDYLQQVGSWENSLLPNEVGSWEYGLPPQLPPKFTRMVVVVRSSDESHVRDLDHFLAPVETVVNALIWNRLVLSDRPGQFWYAVEWQQQSGISTPLIDLHVEWSDKPFRSWMKDQTDTSTS